METTGIIGIIWGLFWDYKVYIGLGVEGLGSRALPIRRIQGSRFVGCSRPLRVVDTVQVLGGLGFRV